MSEVKGSAWDLSNRIDACKKQLDFIRDAIAIAPEGGFSLGGDGTYGLFCCLGKIGDELEDIEKVLLRHDLIERSTIQKVA